MNMSEHETTALAAASNTIHPREWLSFQLGSEQYGIDILRVQEIRGFEAPTKLPNAPHDALGALDLRGVIVPVIDLRVRLGLDAGFDERTVTIVLNIGALTVGVVADSVSSVCVLEPAQILPAPGFAGATHRDYIVGLAQPDPDANRGLLILLDIGRLLHGESAA